MQLVKDLEITFTERSRLEKPVSCRDFIFLPLTDLEKECVYVCVSVCVCM